MSLESGHLERAIRKARRVRKRSFPWHSVIFATIFGLWLLMRYLEHKGIIDLPF